MSIIVAVKKRGQTAVAADTMHSTGTRREHSNNLVARSKLRKVGRSLVGGVGWSVYDNIIDHYLQSQRRTPSLKDERAVFDFFLKLWRTMRERYQLVNEQPDREDRSPFADLDSEFVVVNRNGVFQVASDLSVMQFEKYVALGSGDKFAYGTLHALYDSRRTAEQIALRAAEAAVHFDQSCGGPINVVSIH